MSDEKHNENIHFGRFDVNVTRRTITRISDHVSFKVSRSEVLIFQLLAKSANKTIHREILLEQCWQGKIVTNNSLTVAIKNLRAEFSKINEKKIILTEPKVGYYICSSSLANCRQHNDQTTTPKKNAIKNTTNAPLVGKQNKTKLVDFKISDLFVVIIFFFITLIISYRFLFFIDSTSVEGLPVTYNGSPLPKPIKKIIIKNDDINRWYAYPVNDLCPHHYQLFGVRDEHFINFTSSINQDHCHVK